MPLLARPAVSAFAPSLCRRASRGTPPFFPNPLILPSVGVTCGHENRYASLSIPYCFILLAKLSLTVLNLPSPSEQAEDNDHGPYEQRHQPDRRSAVGPAQLGVREIG